MLIGVNKNPLDYSLKVDEFNYRGFHLDIYEDNIHHQYFTVVNGKILELGLLNTLYKEDLKHLIDSKLDTINTFNNKFPGVKLTWIQNGSFRDIALYHWNRILKIYLIADTTKFNLDTILQDAEKIIKKLFVKTKKRDIHFIDNDV